jgi:hypothetical protein
MATTVNPLDEPASTRTERWVNGVLLGPAVPIMLGVYCIVWRKVLIPAKQGFLEFRGWQAVACGIACISLGLMIHFQVFWSHHPRFPAIGEMGKAIALLGVSASILFVYFSWWIN